MKKATKTSQDFTAGLSNKAKIKKNKSMHRINNLYINENHSQTFWKSPLTMSLSKKSLVSKGMDMRNLNNHT